MPKKIKRGKWEGAALGVRWWKAVFDSYDIPMAELEHKFTDVADWRLDFAWPQWKIAVEVNGGIWAQLPSHTGAGHIRDMKKITQAQIEGWIVLQVTPQQRDNGEMMLLIKQAIATKTKQR